MKIFRDYLLTCLKLPPYRTPTRATDSSCTGRFRGEIELFLLVIEQKIDYFCN